VLDATVGRLRLVIHQDLDCGPIRKTQHGTQVHGSHHLEYMVSVDAVRWSHDEAGETVHSAVLDSVVTVPAWRQIGACMNLRRFDHEIWVNLMRRFKPNIECARSNVKTRILANEVNQASGIATRKPEAASDYSREEAQRLTPVLGYLRLLGLR